MFFIPEILKYIIMSPNKRCFIFVKCFLYNEPSLYWSSLSTGIEHLMFFTDQGLFPGISCLSTSNAGGMSAAPSQGKRLFHVALKCKGYLST